MVWNQICRRFLFNESKSRITNPFFGRSLVAFWLLIISIECDKTRDIENSQKQRNSIEETNKVVLVAKYGAQQTEYEFQKQQDRERQRETETEREDEDEGE